MKAYNTVKTNLKQSSIEVIAKQLGYNSTKTASKTIQSFLDTKNIYDWLNNAHYDLKYTSIGFFNKLCHIYKIDEEDINNELQEYEKIKAEIKKHQYSSIFVNTNFKRKNEPIFALAFLESKRNIRLDTDILLFKTDDEILDLVSEVVKQHYVKNSGGLAIWGNIVNYVYHNSDNKRYIFNTQGIAIKDVDVCETKATLTL